jgi:hypothetical protein
MLRLRRVWSVVDRNRRLSTSVVGAALAVATWCLLVPVGLSAEVRYRFRQRRIPAGPCTPPSSEGWPSTTRLWLPSCSIGIRHAYPRTSTCSTGKT